MNPRIQSSPPIQNSPVGAPVFPFVGVSLRLHYRSGEPHVIHNVRLECEGGASETGETATPKLLVSRDSGNKRNR